MYRGRVCSPVYWGLLTSTGCHFWGMNCVILVISMVLESTRINSETLTLSLTSIIPDMKYFQPLFSSGCLLVGFIHKHLECTCPCFILSLLKHLFSNFSQVLKTPPHYCGLSRRKEVYRSNIWRS